VEVTLHLDRSGQLQARADLPSAGLSFEDVVHVLVPTASPEVLEKELQSAADRLIDLRRRSFRGALPAVVQRLAGADSLLAEARAGLAPVRGGDTDAAQRLHRLLLDLNGALDAAEDEIRWPELEARANDRLAAWISWVAGLGTAAEQQLCDQAVQAIHGARERRDAEELERQLATVSALSEAAYSRDPEAPAWNFEWYEAHLTEAIDVPKAQALLDQGRSLRRQGNLEALRTVNRQLYALFPGTPAERRKSFGSGLS
jgi:molecular chaperone DnaK